jgi:hypothetical protein
MKIVLHTLHGGWERKQWAVITVQYCLKGVDGMTQQIKGQLETVDMG